MRTKQINQWLRRSFFFAFNFIHNPRQYLESIQTLRKRSYHNLDHSLLIFSLGPCNGAHALASFYHDIEDDCLDCTEKIRNTWMPSILSYTLWQAISLIIASKTHDRYYGAEEFRFQMVDLYAYLASESNYTKVRKEYSQYSDSEFMRGRLKVIQPLAHYLNKDDTKQKILSTFPLDKYDQIISVLNSGFDSEIQNMTNKLRKLSSSLETTTP